MSEYDTWLSSLGTRRRDLTGSDQVRGQAFLHTINHQGDVSAQALTGTIKASPDAEAELATFTIGTASYESGTDMTTWVVSLTGTQTEALPADANGDGVETFIYDFLLANNRLFGGLFTISGFVTEPA